MKLYEYGWEIPCIFRLWAAQSEAAHILSLMGGRAAIQGRKPAETNTFPDRRREVIDYGGISH